MPMIKHSEKDIILDNFSSALEELDRCDLDPELASERQEVIDRINFWRGKAIALGIDDVYETVISWAEGRADAEAD